MRAPHVPPHTAHREQVPDADRPPAHRPQHPLGAERHRRDDDGFQDDERERDDQQQGRRALDLLGHGDEDHPCHGERREVNHGVAGDRAEAHLDLRGPRDAEKQRRSERSRRAERVTGDEVEREEPDGDSGGPDQPRDQAAPQQRMGPQRDRTERAGVVLHAVQKGHERDAGHEVRAEHVLPRQHVEQPGAGEEQGDVEDDVKHEEPEHHAEERAGGSLERRDGQGHGHAKERERPEMEDGVGGDEAHRRLRGLLVEQRGGEGGGRVERLARQEVHYEKPECHDQPRQNPTHRALDDDTLKRSLHDRYPPFVLGALLPPISCGPPPAQPPVRYSIFAGRFPILVPMTGHATPPDLPPGLLEEYLAGMRPVLVALAGLAERLAATRNDLAALEALRRETHKIHGSARSFGFMEVSRLAAGMEATVRDWISWPGDPEVDRGSLTRWFVARLAEMLGLEVPRPAAVAPRPRVGPAPRPPQATTRPTQQPQRNPPPTPARARAAPPPPRPQPKAEPPAGSPAKADLPWILPPNAAPPEPPAPALEHPPPPPPNPPPAPPKPAPAPSPPPAEAPPAPAGEVPEIVFVEDDAALAELLAYGLNSRGYRFVAYRNGREALQELLEIGRAHV